MRKEEIQEAYSKLHASEELVKEVLMLEEKKTLLSQMHLRRGRMLCGMICALLIAACAVVLSLSSLGIPSYAEVAGDKELDVTFFVPKYEAPPYEVKPEDKYLISSFNNGQSSNLYSGPTFSMTLRLDEKTMEYDRLLIFLDGKRIEPDFDSCMWLYASYPDGTEGRVFTIVVKETTRVDIILHDNETSSILQQVSMLIDPTEDGWNVMMEESDMNLLESGQLKIIG